MVLLVAGYTDQVETSPEGCPLTRNVPLLLVRTTLPVPVVGDKVTEVVGFVRNIGVDPLFHTSWFCVDINLR